VITDSAFYAVAVPAVLLAGISKGGFAGGVGFIGVVLLTFVIPAAEAAAILLPILCIMDLTGGWAYRNAWHRPSMAVLLPGALIGVVIGAFLFRSFSDQYLRLIVGSIGVVFGINYYLRRGASAPPRTPSIAAGTFWGVVSGFTSTLIHAGAPAYSVYMLPKRLETALYVGTSAIFFMIVNYVKLVPYAWLGLFDARNLTTSLVLAPLAPVGVWLGVWLQRRIAPGPFYRICYALLLLSGAKLMWDGVAPWFG